MLKIVFIGLVWPEPTSSAAGWRILHLVKLLLQRCEIHFLSAASKTMYSFDLQSIGVQEHSILLNDASFDSLLKDINPFAVVFDRFMVEEQYGWRVAESVPSALRILDTEDLHFLRAAREEAYRKNKALDYYTTIAKREIASILRVDLALLISKFEGELLQEQFKVDKEQLFFLPFQEEQLVFPVVRKNFQERKDLLFIGNFIHQPNWHTVLQLKQKIWPILSQKLPQAELHIYGAYASEKVYQLHNPKERFFIMGRADSARETMEKYRILLAPIPFGAGAKGKFVDSMFAGTPNITSTVGAEDMLLEDQWPGFVTDDLETCISRSVELYTNEILWHEAREIGYHIFNKKIADTSFSEAFLFWLEEAKDRIVEIRKRNFIGQLLQQQQFNATKYMSLWIEEKNKKEN